MMKHAGVGFFAALTGVLLLGSPHSFGQTRFGQTNGEGQFGSSSFQSVPSYQSYQGNWQQQPNADVTCGPSPYGCGAAPPQTSPNNPPPPPTETEAQPSIR